MPDAWEQWIGQLIDGKFLLLRYLGGSEQSGVFLTERQERGQVQQAAIKLIPVAADGGERQLSLWSRAAKLSHAHLIKLHEMGRCEPGGVPRLYVVMEFADENVATVLPHRALTPAEARILLDSTLQALGYLQEKGFVHAHIKPSNIMADGDQVKLSSEGLLRAGEVFDASGGLTAYDAPEYGHGQAIVARPASPAGDVWSLAMTLGEALTQNILAEQASAQADAPLPAALREPFLDIVRHGLRWQPEDRWTIAEIAQRLHGGAVSAHSSHPSVRREKPTPAPLRVHGLKLGRYAIPAAAGLALLVVLWAGTRLLHQGSRTPVVPVAALEQPSVQPTPKQEPQPSQQHAESARKSSPPEKRRDSETSTLTPSPVPASVRTEITPGKSESGGAKLAAGGMVQGAVVQQELPEILPSAQASIRGTVRVAVRVDVDSSGNVEGASLAAPGPSKYFARLALQSARHWRFAPARVAGREVLSRWTLRYEFTRAQTKVIPKQDVP